MEGRGHRKQQDLRVLLIEDNPADARLVREMLREVNAPVELLHAINLHAARELLTRGPDLVLLDLSLPGSRGLESLLEVQTWGARLPVIVLTGTEDDMVARRLRDQGALDYLVKGEVDGPQLLKRIREVHQAFNPPSRSSAHRIQVGGEAGGPLLLARSPTMQKLLADIDAVAASDAPVVINGESGTGKELIARALHARSLRATRPLVSVNCAAFPETLIDAELFGHERGAFTGAVQKRAGRFQSADGGTLFLDEIGELAPMAQAKLLRVLAEGTFEPVGSDQTVKVDVRLICATHRDLRQLVEEGKFRADLFYRLKVLQLTLPPVRERREDIPLLVEEFFQELAPDRKVPEVEDAVWQVLQDYPFPGNVRELRHAIEHAIVLSRGGRITLTHFPPEIAGWKRQAGDGGGGLEPLSDAVKAFERRYLLRALSRCRGNRSQTAQALGISRKSLWEKMKQYEIRPEEFDGGEVAEA